MGDRIDRIINDYFEREDWLRARALINKELRRNKNSHWLITRLATTYYEMRDYKRALKLSEKALRLAPRCPLALWDYANALEGTGQTSKAIRIWHGLLAKGIERVASDECGEGVRWARSLLNDCRYRIALAYADLEKLDTAISYLKKHIANRSPGIPSIYPLLETKKKLTQLQEQLHEARM